MKPNKLPKPIHVSTGDQGLVQGTIDDFFVATVNYLVSKKGADQRYFEIRVNNLGVPPQEYTNDIIHRLLYKDRVIAVVTESRTEFNYIQYDFFRNIANVPGRK